MLQVLEQQPINKEANPHRHLIARQLGDLCTARLYPRGISTSSQITSRTQARTRLASARVVAV